MNRKPSVMLGLLSLLVMQSMFGFIAWTLWQVAAMNCSLLPSIPLVTGLALWMIVFLAIGVPTYFAGIMLADVKPLEDSKKSS